jgi:hypothetical protein
MAAPTSGTGTPATASRRTRRAGAGALSMSQRDIDGLILLAEHYGAPADLLAAALRAQPDNLYAIAARWRRAGYADMSRFGPGPAWYWLTREGMAATGLKYPAAKPPLIRLAHVRAVLAVRLWLQNNPIWHDDRAWWHSERRLRAGRPPGREGHLPDAEIHWPSLEGSRYAGQVWAIEVELTPKPFDRTTRIMAGLLSSARYSQVVYLTAPAARSVVNRAASMLPPGEQDCLAVRDLPAAAFPPEP